jgi:hypothetical protein
MQRHKKLRDIDRHQNTANKTLLPRQFLFHDDVLRDGKDTAVIICGARRTAAVYLTVGLSTAWGLSSLSKERLNPRIFEEWSGLLSRLHANPRTRIRTSKLELRNFF